MCRSWKEEAEADREFWLRFSGEERVGIVEPADPNHGAFLTELSRLDIRALIIGVHAIAYYSKPRYCETLEVFVDLDFAPQTEALAGPTINVVTSLPPVTFEEAWPNRVEGKFAQQAAWFISRGDYLRNREASSAPYASWDSDLLRRFL